MGIVDLLLFHEVTIDEDSAQASICFAGLSKLLQRGYSRLEDFLGNETLAKRDLGENEIE